MTTCGNQWPITLQRTPHRGRTFTIFKVPANLRDMSPDCFNVKTLQLGLQDRMSPPDEPYRALEDLKIEIASIIDRKLTPPMSWAGFASAVVGNVDTIKQNFETCSIPDPAVQHHLALDALFTVFYFQYLNASTFSIPEFKNLSEEFRATLRSVEMSDFLLVENQIPMELLKKVIDEMCNIDGTRHGNRAEVVADTLHVVLVNAISTLLPIAYPTVVYPIPDSARQRSMCERVMEGIFGPVGTCVRRIYDGCCKEDVTDDRLLLDYLGSNYPPRSNQLGLGTCRHILDCVYRVVCGHIELPYNWEVGQDNWFLENIPSATRLEEVGIKVEHSTQCTGNSVKLNGRFCSWIRSARLMLPKVVIWDSTIVKFRNLAIYEQLLGQNFEAQYCGDFRCFLICMSQLNRRETDSELLSKRGLLDMYVENEVVARIWERSLEGVQRPIASKEWKACYDNIHKHCRSGWKRWRRKHCGLFFAEPWKKWSVVAAILLLIMTALQTWFTVVNSDSSKERWPPRIGHNRTP